MRKPLLVLLFSLLCVANVMAAGEANYCIKFSTITAHEKEWEDQGNYTLTSVSGLSGQPASGNRCSISTVSQSVFHLPDNLLSLRVRR